MKKKSNPFIKPFLLISFFLIISACSALKYKPTSTKDVPVNVKDRVAKNIEEGRGIKLFGDKNSSGGTFQFASSNPLWRASIEVLDFIPILSASYSGGLLITDWYDDGDKNESIKITIRFLSNEISTNAIDVSVYKKNCKAYENCKTLKTKGKINEELEIAILQKASVLKKEDLAKKK